MSERIEALLGTCQLPPVSETERRGIEAAWKAAQAEAKAAESAPAPPAVRLKCTYCQDGLTQEISIYCAACLAPHHRECFEEHGRCAAPGCEGTLLVEPRAARPTRKPRWRPWAFLGARAAMSGGRGRAVPALVAALLAAATTTGVLYHELTTPAEWKLDSSASAEPIQVAVGETVLFVEPWAEVDPPQSVGFTNLSGAANIHHTDTVARVEWAVPHTKGRAQFLITGLEEGQTTFQLRFDRSRRIKEFTILVEGASPHEVNRDVRLASLRSWSEAELERAFEQHWKQAQELIRWRDGGRKESNYHRAALTLDRAVDVAQALAQQQRGSRQSEQRLRRAEDLAMRAHEEYELFAEQLVARYEESVRMGAPEGARIVNLRAALRALHDPCDPRFLRLHLILKEAYGHEFEVQPCEEVRSAPPRPTPEDRPEAEPARAPEAPSGEQPPEDVAPEVSEPEPEPAPPARPAPHETPETVGGSLVVDLENGVGPQGQPLGSSFTARGLTSPMPDGTLLYVTLYAKWYETEQPVSIMRVAVKNNAYEATKTWPKRLLAPLVYHAVVELRVDKQSAPIRQWLVSEYGYTPSQPQRIDEKWETVGGVLDREAFPAQNLEVLRSFVLELLSMLQTYEDEAVRDASAGESLARSLERLQRDMRDYRDRYVFVPEGSLLKRIQQTIKVSGSLARDSLDGPSEFRARKLKTLRGEVETLLKTIKMLEPEDVRRPVAVPGGGRRER